MAAVQRMINPRSIAIVGASVDKRSLGGFVLGNLERFGFPGQIHLVSRSSESIDGRPCVKTIDELPPGIDLAVLAIPESGTLEAVRSLGARGVAASILFASGFAEAGAAGAASQQALADAACQSGMLLVGPNCMGFTNFADAVPATFEPIAPYPFANRKGVCVVAQSGFMAANVREGLIGRGLPVSLVFSTGNEASIGIEDVLGHCVADPHARLVVVYAEQIRHPQRFLRLAAQAREAGKPVVLLMPGKSARARTAAQSHTGALAGDHATAVALLKAEAVVAVETLDELFDVAAILLQFPTPPAGGTAFVTGSGAMKNIALDFAEDIGLPLPVLAADTTQRLTQMLPAYAVAENPLDYTTVGVRQPGLIGEIVETMLDDPAIGSLVLSIPAGPAMAQRDKAEHIVPVLGRATKPAVLVVSGDGGPIEPFFLEAIRASGTPFFRSTDRALRALRQVHAFAQVLQRCQVPRAVAPGVALPGPTPAGGAFPEYLGKAWLAQLGIAIPAGSLATTESEAVGIAAAIGYPVVLKAQAGELRHKSDAGGVMLGLVDDAALRAGWRRMQDNIARQRPGLRLDGLLVESLGQRGLELVVGARRDPDWGAVLLVGLGGIWIEALNDVRLIPAAMAETDIVHELRQLKAAAVLAGARGDAPVDLAAIARVVAQLGAQMLANPAISEIDINPLVAYPLGSGRPLVALDALLVVQP